MSKELFPDYIRIHYQQHADQSMRAVEYDRRVKLALKSTRRADIFRARLIALLQTVKAFQKPVNAPHQPRVVHRRV